MEPVMAVTTQTATIPAGQSLSNSINACANTPVRVRMPATWSGGRTSKITFQISTDDITFMDYFNPDGTEVSAVVTLNTTTRIEHPTGGKGGTYFKIRCGSREAPTVQPVSISFVVVLES
jgi:hypothetical protein